MIRALIVDDEFLARKRLEKLLEAHSSIKVVGEAKNVKDAVLQIDEKRPHLVLLDIQMPGGNGFDILNKVRHRAFHIVLTTAYDQFAIKAFDVQAVDYLLKPFDERRLAEALERVQDRIRLQQVSGLEDKMMALLRSFHAERSDHLEYFEMKEKGRLIRVLTEDVLYLKANGNYISLATKERKHVLRSTLNAVEQDLNPGQFTRVHRSVILNRHHVTQIRYQGNNEYKIEMSDGHQITSGRSYKENLDGIISD